VRVIVDTNIIVSGLISPTGPPGNIVDALLQGFLVPVMSPATLAELEAVLMRPRLRTLFERAGVEAMEFLTEFRELADIVEPGPTDIAVRDANDGSSWSWLQRVLQWSFSLPAIETLNGDITPTCQ
jgi:putative PIN family toxin of toxin-antitoxin system